MRPALIDLGNQFTKNQSLLIVGDVVESKISFRARTGRIQEAYKWLDVRKVKAFYNLVDNLGFEEGVRCLVQTSGL
jgi:solute carrier family 12 sodium/potassium/chloride transporter 2